MSAEERKELIEHIISLLDTLGNIVPADQSSKDIVQSKDCML